MLFPHARLVSLIFIFPVRWRASTYLLMWLGLQILGALFSENAIAWWAHIGGYAVGAVLARRWLKEKPPLPTNAPPKPLEWR